jgi:Glycosyl hydrolases family 18
MPTFGLLPSDVVANSRGDVEGGVTLALYATKANADASTGQLASVTSDLTGRWTYTHATLGVIWVRTPPGLISATGTVYATIAPEVIGSGGGGAVTSVAGRTGVVTLANTDVSGLGNASTKNVGTTSGTVAAGNDSRFSSGGGAVTSVAGRTGVVVLANTDISGLGNASTKAVGTATGTVAAGDDPRFSSSGGGSPRSSSVLAPQVVGGYWETWETQTVAQVNSTYNLIYLSFLTPDTTPGAVKLQPLSSPYTTANLKVDIATKRAAGVTVLASIGGAGAASTTNVSFTTSGHVSAFVASIQALQASIGPFDGIDIDVEDDPALAYPSLVVSACSQLKTLYPGFIISYCAAGYDWIINGPSVCTALNTAGVLDVVGVMNYDWPAVTDAAKLAQTTDATEYWAARISGDWSRILLGFELYPSESADNTMTTALAMTAWGQVHTAHSTIRGGFVWDTFDDSIQSNPFALNLAPLIIGSMAGGGGVTSVAGKTGVVVLANTDISGFGNASTKNVGTAAGTVAAGNDARFSSGGHSFTFSATGVLTAGAGMLRLYNPTSGTLVISNVRASVGTAPTGAAILVDVTKNGITIFTTQSARPSIAIGGFTAVSGSPAVTSWAAGEYLTVDVDQVGSTVAGSNLTVQVFTA